MRRRWPWTPDVVAAVALFETARRARRHDISQAEENVFRLVNDAPEVIHPPVWAVMQSGSLGAVVVVAAELARRRRPRRATAALIFGTAAWGGVKAVKPIIGRGRPMCHLERVTVRGEHQTGLGYPSGHAAVALTLALIATHDGTPITRLVRYVSPGSLVPPGCMSARTSRTTSPAAWRSVCWVDAPPTRHSTVVAEMPQPKS